MELPEDNMELPDDKWNLEHFHRHLQVAAQLEAWTIPYYMSAMFSIVDRSALPYQLIQSVVHQEMLHLQLVANIANAYQYSPQLQPEWFSYATIPFLDFTLDRIDPRKEFPKYSPQIGPLDEARIDTMCLIEYPHWLTGAELGAKPVYRTSMTQYGSIGEFYNVLEDGAKHLGTSPIAGGQRQVDVFSAFYRRLPNVKVESSGAEGLKQVLLFIDVIRDQGEAAKADDPIHWANQNTADDPQQTRSHYDKFRQIKSLQIRGKLPETYQPKDPGDYTDADRNRQQILIGNFKKFTDALNGLFAGGNPDGFVPLMVTIGGNILACWKNGVIPKFTETATFTGETAMALTAELNRSFYAL